MVRCRAQGRARLPFGSQSFTTSRRNHLWYSGSSQTPRITIVGLGDEPDYHLFYNPEKQPTTGFGVVPDPEKTIVSDPEKIF